MGDVCQPVSGHTGCFLGSGASRLRRFKRGDSLTWRRKVAPEGRQKVAVRRKPVRRSAPLGRFGWLQHLPQEAAVRIVRSMPTPVRLLQSARLISLLTLGSRVLGLVRECLFGYLFSTSQTLSAFRIAFMVPNLARRLFGEGALSAAMIPVVTRCIHEDGEDAARRLCGTVITRLIVGLTALVVLAEAGVALWRWYRPDVALSLTGILLPYMVMICVVAVAGGVLNVRNHFAVPAVAPMLLNVGVIVAAATGAWWLGLTGDTLVRAICIGVLVAGVAQVALMAGALKRANFFPILGGDRRSPHVRAIGKAMAPMILGLSAVQINSFVDYLIAYAFVIVDGERVGPAVLGYAQYLYQLPLGVFGIALATAIFPVLSRKSAQDDRRGVADVFTHGIRLALFVAVPASVGLALVARPLVATLFQRGAFDYPDTLRVASTLVFYGLGLPAYFALHLLVRTFYALGSSRTPARIALCMVGVNLALNLALVGPLEERGLALATAISATLQTVWLAWKLRRTLPEIEWRRIASGAARSLLAAAAMAAVLLFVLPSTPAPITGWMQALPYLAGLVATGVLTYLLVARLLRMDELHGLLRNGASSNNSSV